MKRTLLAALLVVTGCAESPSPLPTVERPDVLVITLDTLRADRTSLHGYERETTPNLDAFAAECFVFDNAFSNSSFTPPSHASILTGRYPAEHGLMHWKRRLDPGVPTSAELFGELGYRTAAFTPMATLVDVLGLDRGFDETVTPPHTELANFAIRLAGAREMNTAALPWLTAGGDPFFAWLHYYDAHRPFAIAGREWTSLYRPDDDPVDPSVGDTERWYQLDAADRRRIGITPAQTEYLKDRYDGGINQLDARLGELFDRLRGAGVLDRAWVVVTADHGEVLDEHAEEWFSHDPHLVDENIHVPLLIRPPGGLDTMRRLDALVQGVDLLPTLLELVDADPLDLPGTSLVPLLDGRADDLGRATIFADRIGDPSPRAKGPDGEPREPTDVEVRRSRDRKQIVRGADHKLIVHLDRRAPGTTDEPLVELWDVDDEGRDVSAEQPAVADTLRRAHAAVLAALDVSEQGDAALDEEMLKKLGYIPDDEDGEETDDS